MSTTFILDQGEFIGGAERFMLDFLGDLSPAESRKISPILIGAKCQEYRKALKAMERAFPVHDFVYPPVRGPWWKKIIHLVRLVVAAKRLKNKIQNLHPPGPVRYISNTPRTHFTLFLAKKIWRLEGKWMVMIHDFTTPPRLMKLIATKADILIANSLPTRNWLHNFLPAEDKKKIRIIENGVSMKDLPPPRPTKQIREILMLARIDPRKGQMQALEAADLLLERNPEIRFTIAGSSVESDPRTGEYEKQLQTFARERKLENVRFEGEVPDGLKRINEADLVLMLPSEGETFGRVAIEALSLGKIVLTFDETGPREILEHFLQYLGREKNIALPREDFIIEKGNVMSLAEKIGEWADHGESKIGELPNFGIQYVQKHYSLRETTKRLVDLCS